MAKMWEGRTAGNVDTAADDFNSSISVDFRMYRQDITGSMAHAAMLGAKNIITRLEADTLIAGLGQILADIEAGTLKADPAAEDVHMFVEAELTARLGDVGKKLHTARSRNDQVALDFRLYLREAFQGIRGKLRALLETILRKAEEERETIMPGYTHLQRAQPVTFGHYLMAYAMMFTRDMERIGDAVRRMNVSPIGCCALAGTTYDTDRVFEARELGFDDICRNSIDGVSDRDFALELLSASSILMMHLSRLCEEMVLFSSWEFRFVEFPDAYTTGSSIMPQKKNPDMAELIRGKTGRVYGDMIALFTTMKGLPLAYNKDMQEDKESVFDAVDTLSACLDLLPPMIGGMRICRENMKKAAAGGFINATDLADYLVKKGLPFRESYKICGRIVAKCMETGEVLETLPLDVYRAFSPLFGEDVYREIALETCVEKRNSAGGTSPASVDAQIAYVRERLQ